MAMLELMFVVAIASLSTPLKQSLKSETHGGPPTNQPTTPVDGIVCDLLVVGGGVSGAFVAARYRQFNPKDKICIVEMNSVVSGHWCFCDAC